MTTYALRIRDEGSDDEREIEADTLDEARNQIADECDDWVQDGDWGDDGAAVQVWWQLFAGNDMVDDGSETIDIEPNHKALIRAAGGDPDCEHDWTSEGEGGCTENPGVWSTGGTTLVYASHCRKCGLHREEVDPGSQRNPGQHPTVKYYQPEPESDDETERD